MTSSYITPITDRTWDDVEYAKTHQNDLVNKNKGAWNYTDLNRICNNLKYAAEWMYEQGFLPQPYTMSIKYDWTEDDIITIDQLNIMIINNMNNLKSYSRDDLEWYSISSVININYSLANWIERNIHQLATQVPLPPDTFKLTVEDGLGSGIYEARTVVNIRAEAPESGMVFDHWSGDHLENIENAFAANTTYTMPNEDITLRAHYTSTVSHKLKVITHTNTIEQNLYMGAIISIEADPAPNGKVFHHWDTNPDGYEENFYEPAATTKFTMPNIDITLTAVYITTGKKQLRVINGTGSGLYDYGIYVQIAPTLPSNATFTQWTGDTQYLIGPATQAYNSVKIPDLNVITLTANWTTPPTPPTPPVTNVSLTVINGTITNTGETSGTFTQGDYISITANTPSENQVFTYWSKSGGGSISNSNNMNTFVSIGSTGTIVTANYRILEYFTLTVITNDGTTTNTIEKQSSFTINAGTAPNGYTFDHWEGDTSGLNIYQSSASATMGSSDRTITAVYRLFEYHTLTVITNSGTTTQLKERDDYFSINALPAPTGYVFSYWSGDVSSYKPPKFNSSVSYTFDINSASTGTYMNTSDRTITAVYRSINPHTLTVNQPSGDVIYTENEFDTLQITAESQTGKRFIGWSLSGYGKLSTSSGQTTTYTFGNGDGVLTPNYVNIWTITVIDGTINGSSNIILDEGSTYPLNCKSLLIYEKFDGWILSGPGTIRNTVASSTYFTVGAGDAIITANIDQYPDKTLTIYFQDPDTEEVSVYSRNTYTYGTQLKDIIAPIAPDKTTFLTWLGGDQDINMISPSALASTININALTRDVSITATYFYPEAPEYYILNVYNGYPQNQSVQVGSQVIIRANTPSQGYEFYKWYGDTQYIVNQSGLDDPENSIIMPRKSITLYAKYKVIGELPLFRVSVSNGIASASYETGDGIEESPTIIHEEQGVYIDIPAGVEVTLTADADLVGWVFDYWSGNFEVAGVDDINTTINPTTFTMVENDLNITMIRRELDTYTVYTTDATGPGTAYESRTYPISGNKQDTDSVHYTFVGWECVDANNENCISAIARPDLEETTITIMNRDLWITAKYKAYYKLTVVNGQDSGNHFYYEGETVNTITANVPTPGSNLIFDHWEDPNEIITTNIYDETPTIVMKNTVSTITAIYTATDGNGNSIVIAGNDLHTNMIRRSTSTLVNGIYAVGTLVFDRDGCIGIITEVNPDHNDDTDDFRTQKLFYGGNF